MRAGRWMFILALLFALSVGLVVINRPVTAASAGCSAVGSALTSAPDAPYDNTESRSYTGDFSTGEVISASATGFDNPGTGYPVTLTVNGTVQDPYTIPSDGSYTVIAAVDSLPEPANVTVGCSAPPPPASSTPTATATATLTPVPPTATTAPSNTPRPTATRWPGYTDGRLGGDPAEYYSLWCSGNTLNIWSAASGRGVQLAAIPLTSLIAQPVGLAVPVPVAGGVLILTRSSADAFVIQGNTGNGAPAPGSKTFGLAQCITANGGAPVVAPSATPLVRTVLPTRTPTRPPTRTPSPAPSPTMTPTLVTSKWFGDLFTSSNDTDGDGTPDGFDFCKTVPGPIYGCPDPDGDGLAGPWDLCPDVAGSTSRGCPDGDEDGVADAVDLCPDYSPPADQNAQGCLDSDRDGVPNTIDWCPVQEVVAGTTQFQGCNDPDGDSYVNGARVPEWFRDDCPAVNGAYYDNGCPPPTAQVVPTVNAAATLFAYAQQQGAFEGLVLQGFATATPGCDTSSYGFCGLK